MHINEDGQPEHSIKSAHVPDEHQVRTDTDHHKQQCGPDPLYYVENAAQSDCTVVNLTGLLVLKQLATFQSTRTKSRRIRVKVASSY